MRGGGKPPRYSQPSYRPYPLLMHQVTGKSGAYVEIPSLLYHSAIVHLVARHVALEGFEAPLLVSQLGPQLLRLLLEPYDARLNHDTGPSDYVSCGAHPTFLNP
jgi:hypothetical protein